MSPQSSEYFIKYWFYFCNKKIWLTKYFCFCFSPEQLLGNDTTQQFNDLKVNLSDVNILNNDTRQSLIDLSNSGVDEIDFGAFLNQVTNFSLFCC